MITESDLDKYRNIYKEKFGQEISGEAAQEQAVKLLRLTQIVLEDMGLTLSNK